MGHSIQRIGPKRVMANDHDLRVIVALLDRYADRFAEIPRQLRATVNRWVSEEPFWAPGVIDFRLNDLVRDSSQTGALAELLRHMEDEIAAKGEYIRREDVREVLNINPALQSGDYPTQGLLKAITELRELLTVTPVTDEGRGPKGPKGTAT